MAEHYRPKIGNQKAGYYQGYYCGRCGAGGLSMSGRCTKGTVGIDHSGICLANPTLVKRLDTANTEEAETKRKFIHGIKHGKPAETGNTWEYRGHRHRGNRLERW